MMAEIDLKSYTTRAKELESAIYTQKRLMSSQETILKEQSPKAPQKLKVDAPKKPTRIEPVKVYDSGVIASIVLSVCLLVFIIPLLFLVFVGEFGFFFIALLFGVPYYFVVKLIIKSININKITNENKEKQYIEQEERYPLLLEQYRHEIAEANENYQKALNGYSINVSRHNQRYTETMNKHNSALSTLENSLEQLYSENVIFPKYRNLVAITAINEYLMSGRCDKLEGPDGAYNLYEMELRQNIIIAQLSSIIDNLEQIRSNQYSLYEELQKSNDTINEILSETRRMKETTKLTAYFAGVTALAETSPKYYHGIVM